MLNPAYPPRIVPSISSCPAGLVTRATEQLVDEGCNLVHVDVMDGSFGFRPANGLSLLRQLNGLRLGSACGFDVHVAVAEPESVIDEVAAAGANRVSVHWAGRRGRAETARRLRERGIAFGLALLPGCVFEIRDFEREGCTIAHFVTARGGAFAREMLDSLREIALERPAWLEVSVDGGVSRSEIAECVRSGARSLIIGSALFTCHDPAAAWQELTNEAASAFASMP